MPNLFPVITGDIGGTNARFEWIGDVDAPPRSLGTVKTADYDGPEAAILACLERADLPRPKTALLAAAGPITDEGLDLTNCAWVIRPDPFLETTGFSRLQLLNDFEAQALALPFFAASDVCAISGPRSGSRLGRRSQSAPTATPMKDSNTFTKAVLGPGTGLGVGFMVRAQGKWVPVPGEGGHVDLGPRTPFEAKLWPHLNTIGGRISAEQILSGDGLENLHQAMQKTLQSDDGQTNVGFRTAPQITAAALEDGGSIAARTLNLFCTVLGRLAGDLAVTSMAYGGVYLAGGIVQKIAPFVHTSGFREAFEDKAPHTELMRTMPTWLVQHELPALLGLAQLAKRPDDFLMDMDHRSWDI
ncbi:MAG: glucokinase [Pseudomonadota bacterium]